MENSIGPISADDAAAALRTADNVRASLTQGLLLPSHFYSAIGAAITVQIATAAAGLPNADTWGLGILVAGVAAFVVVGAVQLWRFRTLNGVWVAGMASRVVGGTANIASTTYAITATAAVWAGFSNLWWVVALSSVLGGIGYAVSGRRWWRSYQADPVANSRAESAVWLATLGCVAVGLMVALVIGS